MISQNINDYNKISNFQSVQSKIGKGNDNHKRSHSDNIFKTKLLQETRQKSSNAHLGKHARQHSQHIQQIIIEIKCNGVQYTKRQKMHTSFLIAKQLVLCCSTNKTQLLTRAYL